MNRVDLAVVGAGFAGLACARAAAARGLSVTVLERKARPGDAVRTTGILVKEAVDELDPPRRLTRRIRGVRLYSPALRTVDLESPGYAFYATDTGPLLDWLADLARGAGAEVRGGTAFRGAERGGRGRIRLAGAGIEARRVVGADGALSRVAREFGLGRNREFLAGAEVEMAGVRGLDGDRLHCFLDPVLAPGYLGWIVPGVRFAQVGLACRPPARPRLDRFLARVARVVDLDRATVVGRRAGPIPVGGPVRPAAGGGAILLGDAAGDVSPLTAGGIHPALAAGRRLGAALAEHLLDGGPDPAATVAARYPRRRAKALLRRAADAHVPPELLDRLLGSRTFLSLAQTVFFHHRGLFSLRAQREVAGIFFSSLNASPR